MELPSSLFDRYIGRPRRLWIALGICAALFVAPFAIVLAQGDLDEMLHTGQWRGLLVPPVIITYIALVAPKMTQMGDQVLDSFRRLVLIDDASLARIVTQAGYVKPRGEALAIGIGLVMGFGAGSRSVGATISPLALEWLVASSLMFGLLAWTIYGSLVSTRMTTAVLRQPLRLDPLDITPFEPVGRQSLITALVFVGGITLSLLLVGFVPTDGARLAFWLSYIPFALVPVLIFFLNMYPTHRVIAAARDAEQRAARARIRAAYQDLLARRNGGLNAESIPAEINALIAYDQLLQKVRTWPYNTAMLRTLGVSILIPIGTTVARTAFDYLVK